MKQVLFATLEQLKKRIFKWRQNDPKNEDLVNAG